MRWHGVRRRRPAPRRGGLALLLLVGCRGAEPAATTSRPAAEDAVPVTVAAAARRDMPEQVQAIGWVEAFASVTIKPQVEGQLTEVHFTEGQSVRAGDALYTIDPRPFVAELRLAEANLLKDQALARDAEREAQRVTDLFAQNVAADRERDQAQAAADAIRAQVQADQAAVENARLRLEYCNIRSPLEGRAGARLVDRGNIVKANETELVTINQISPVFAAFSVAERHLPTIQEYSRAGPLVAAVRFPGESEAGSVGWLTFVDNRVDSSTGMVRLKATFANEDHRLWPGQFVNVTLVLTTQRDAVVVPTSALQTSQAGTFLFVVGGDGAAEMRSVSLGATTGDSTVIASGLEAGEVVVTDGQLRVTPGAKVRARDAQR